MISINATLIIQFINFLILVFILNRLMFRPVLKVVEDRSNHIDDTMSKLVNIENETKELIDRCVSLERNARKEAGNESSKFKKEALEIADKIFGDARDEVAIIKARVNREIEEKIENARQSLKTEATQLADVLTEKVIGRRISN